MDKLPIGEVIFKLRKEKNITQDQLGNFIGVSTAAVSKWESGISYPDITLLPILATFFNVSIDMLLNYNIEISDGEVMKIFSQCEAEFSTGDLEKAIDLSKNYVLKYPGSYLLKLRIGFLFTMYSWKGKGEEEYMNMIVYAIELFEDLAKNCSKMELVEAALFQLGALYSGIGEEDKAIEALNKINKSQCDPNDILASIYIQKNELKKGRELFQSKLYKSIHDISLICMALANSHSKNEKNLILVEKYYNLSIKIKEAFLPEAASVIGLSTEYLNFAQSYLKFNEKEKAIEMLKKMIEDMKRNDINRPGKFNDVWCFNEIKDGERTITMNLYENMFKIFEGEEFDLIRESDDFIDIVKDLKDIEKRSISR
ncbi:HTH-type transcriptional regulator Xre [Clostridium homopropionicum DSM 5847]|uniref:HTH-type transcriptional regulator Xre n=1 Tax=Clostridium homopropionicum DSM 5847 TaxID=1121318 RepID=A0A0L6Z764_9CLOT|nr:helix-turn-helix transcriptional regulator [Clostridium homopropionicum]KOA18663.1 HTH-type transcriptional regulator Xre [Clostridium homopropionicum DSM 5847]SFG51864.1 Transcriptional regulator, contains XRE-family HTH domain [Clostridium homopropionicum]